MSGSNNQADGGGFLISGLIGAFVFIGAELAFSFLDDNRKEKVQKEVNDYQTGQIDVNGVDGKRETIEKQLELKVQSMMSKTDYVCLDQFKSFKNPLLAIAYIYDPKSIFFNPIEIIIRNIDRILCLRVQIKNKTIVPTSHDQVDLLAFVRNVSINLDTLSRMLNIPIHSQHQQLKKNEDIHQTTSVFSKDALDQNASNSEANQTKANLFQLDTVVENALRKAFLDLKFLVNEQMVTISQMISATISPQK